MDVKKIRKDFPVLERKFNNKPIVYFDNSCMSLKPKQVVDAMNEYYYSYPACAGRSSHKLGDIVTEKYHDARKRIAKFVNAKRESEIIFTKNTTEGINMVANSFGLKSGDVVLTSDREHNSNLLPWIRLARTSGIKHEMVFSEEDMTFNLGEFERKVKSLKGNLKLVSIIHTSNIDGYTFPVREIAKISHDAGAMVLVDGAQSVPHKKVDVRKLDVDFLAFSGHKMLGPSGTGALYAKQEILEKMQPFVMGGETVKDSTYDDYIILPPPQRFEAGLQNYAGSIGMAAAADYIDGIGLENIGKHELALNKIMTEGLSEIDKVSILGHSNPEMRGGIVSFNIKGMFPHDVALMLDDTANIMVRSGAHCVHSWFNSHGIKGSVRASVYLYNTEEEARLFVDKVREISKLA